MTRSTSMIQKDARVVEAFWLSISSYRGRRVPRLRGDQPSRCLPLLSVRGPTSRGLVGIEASPEGGAFWMVFWAGLCRWLFCFLIGWAD